MTFKQPRGNRRWIAVSTMLTGASLGLSALLYRLTKQHGQTLLQIDELQSRAPQPAQPAPMTNRQHLFEYGAPTGSVGMNFELPSTSGAMCTLTQLKGRRVLLIFIAPDCPASRSMLPGLARLTADPAPEQPQVVIISSGAMDVNRELAEHFQITVPFLVQDRNDVSLLYFIDATPAAYLLDTDGTTEMNRIEGPLAILGALLALTVDAAAILVDKMTSSSTEFLRPMIPLQRADDMPELRLRLLDGQVLDASQHRGQRTLYVFFDPLYAPCVDLLQDLAAVQRDPLQPEVIMITRRDPELTRALAARHDMPYPVALQEHWELSRLIGTLAVPAACLVTADGYLESAVAEGQQAIQALVKPLRARSGERRLVSLASMMR